MTTGKLDIKKPHFVSEVRNLRQCDRVNNVTCRVLHPLGDNASIICIKPDKAKSEANIEVKATHVHKTAKLGAFPEASSFETPSSDYGRMCSLNIRPSVHSEGYPSTAWSRPSCTTGKNYPGSTTEDFSRPQQRNFLHRNRLNVVNLNR